MNYCELFNLRLTLDTLKESYVDFAFQKITANTNRPIKHLENTLRLVGTFAYHGNLHNNALLLTNTSYQYGGKATEGKVGGLRNTSKQRNLR